MGGKLLDLGFLYGTYGKEEEEEDCGSFLAGDDGFGL